MVKSFVLDTNIILSSNSGGAKVLDGFISGRDANNIVIPGTVLTELDKHKGDSGEIGYNARDFIRTLDSLREEGDLVKGVKIKRGKIVVEPDGVNQDYLPKGFNLDIPDNRIISTCIHLAKKHPRSHYVFVSNDVSCRVAADVCFKAAGVDVAIESYKNDRIKQESDEYKGYINVKDSDCPDLVQALYEDIHDEGVPYDAPEGFYENEYIYFEESGLIAVYENGKLFQVHQPKLSGLKKLYNPRQVMAMHALMAPASEVSLVILTGAPGAGKTFLPVAMAIDQIYEAKTPRYDKMIVTRSNQLGDGEDIGFIPGDPNAKMMPLILPIKNSIENYLRVKNGSNQKSYQAIKQEAEQIFETSMEIFALKYIRGASFVNKCFMLDEAQNVDTQHALAVLTRFGNGCKCIFTGDLSQIDNPKLDRYTSGLAVTKERMRGKGVAIISFENEEIVRGFLARIAAERMSV